MHRSKAELDECGYMGYISVNILTQLDWTPRYPAGQIQQFGRSIFFFRAICLLFHLSPHPTSLPSSPSATIFFRAHGDWTCVHEHSCINVQTTSRSGSLSQGMQGKGPLNVDEIRPEEL